MEFLFDVLVFSFWASLVIVGVLGIVHEVKGIMPTDQSQPIRERLEDEDTVFLIDTLIRR